jgi:hypothetical protein
VASLAVRLCDVARDGTSVLVTKGAINMTRRNSFERPEPLIPGEVYELDLELNATSWIFEKGHRIRISLQGSDWPNMWPTPERTTVSIRMGQASPSGITLPTIPPSGDVLPEPEFLPPVELFKPAESSSGPDGYDLVYDLYSGRIALNARHPRRTFVRELGVELEASLQAEAVVMPDRPWEAHVKGRETVKMKRRDSLVRIEGQNLLSSTKEEFNLLVSLNITLDELPFFSRTWTRTFKRTLS